MKEFTVTTISGESIDVSVEELSQLQQIRWASMAPRELISQDPDDINMNEEGIDFLIKLVTDKTNLDEDMLNEMSMSTLTEVFEQVVRYAFNAVESESEPKETKIDDNAFVDLEDWR